MNFGERREQEDPTGQLPAAFGSIEYLNKNQKKKLRQKRSRLFKSGAATATAVQPLITKNKPTKEQAEKRVKRDHFSIETTDIPKAVLSAEPRQQRPQYSLTSSAQHPTAALLIAPQQQQFRSLLIAPSQVDAPLETMPDPVYRTDMTHAARFLVAHNYHPMSNDNSAAAAAASVPSAAMAAPTHPGTTFLEDPSSPAGSIHIGGTGVGIKYDQLPTESAASAEDESQKAKNNLPRSSGAAIASRFSPLQTAPLPAPSLDLVAPIGPNGMRVYLHGNYHRYYGYRLGQEFEEDPRLALLERPWFSGKRCMDVGCNEGLVTLGIAMKFGSRSMIGVDIDEHLIKRACNHLRAERSSAVVRAAEARMGGMSAADRRAARTAVSALAQTWFVHGDFLESRAELGSIDCLTALSVTKWVHLHRGDVGLREFFARIHSLLAPGGVFILEPQPWKSYRAAADKMRRQGGAELPLPSDSFFRRVGELELRPDQFPELLQEEFGFRLLRRLQPPEETAEGFNRPMFLFRKV
jgi:7SK snRNA methylphosphate capping enzyme